MCIYKYLNVMFNLYFFLREREREREQILDCRQNCTRAAVLALAVGFSFHWTAGQLYHHLVNRWKSSVRGKSMLIQNLITPNPEYLCAVLSVPSSGPWECHLVSCLWILHFCSHGKSKGLWLHQHNRNVPGSLLVFVYLAIRGQVKSYICV